MAYTPKREDPGIELLPEIGLHFKQKLVSGSNYKALLITPEFRTLDSFAQMNSDWIMIDGIVLDTEKNTLNAKELLARIRSRSISTIYGLNGEFSILAKIQNSFFFVTDQMGQRQHSLGEYSGNTYIAPSPGQVLKMAGIERQIDNDVFSIFLGMSKYRPYRKTIWVGCEVIDQGSIIHISNNQVSKDRYWELSYGGGEEQSVDDLVEIYRSSVNARVYPSQKILLTLTGGLDSRSMIGAISKIKELDLTAITMGLPKSAEIEYASQVAKYLGVSFEPYHISPETTFLEDAKLYLQNEDIDLIIQGLWRPFLHSRQNYDYLLHGLDLDVTIGGIYLTDEVAALQSYEGLHEYMLNRSTTIDSDLRTRLFTSNFSKNQDDIIQDFISDIIVSEKQSNVMDTYEKIVMRYSMNRVILQRYRGIRQLVETLSPMYDNALIDFYLNTPPEKRRNYRIFTHFLSGIDRNLMDIPYQRTNLPPSAPVEMWAKAQALEHQIEELYREVARQTNGSVYIPYNRYYTNVDEWMRFNVTWQANIIELLQSKNSIIRQTVLMPDYLDKIIREHQTHKRSYTSILLRLMSAELFLRMEEKSNNNLN